MITKAMLENVLEVTRKELSNTSESTDFKRGIRFVQAALYGEMIKSGKGKAADKLFQTRDVLST